MNHVRIIVRGLWVVSQKALPGVPHDVCFAHELVQGVFRREQDEVRKCALSRVSWEPRCAILPLQSVAGSRKRQPWCKPEGWITGGSPLRNLYSPLWLYKKRIFTSTTLTAETLNERRGWEWVCPRYVRGVHAYGTVNPAFTASPRGVPTRDTYLG